ncbi:MAG: hypothetical protein RR311_18070 [Comamonas sp.]
MLAMFKFAWRAPLNRDTHSAALVADVSGERENSWRVEPCHSAYWPQHELDSFILKMAGHGRAVHAAMMLGDAGYARQQLAAAADIGCPQLRALSVRLSAYFEHAPCARNFETH